MPKSARPEQFQFLSPLGDETDVWLVRDRRDGLLCVRKVLSVYSLPVYTSLIEHPVDGIPPIKALWEEDEHLVLIETYAEGDTLQTLLDQNGPFPEQEVKRIGLSLCRILRQLEERDPPLIHRDIKPQNILLGSDGRITLLDFNAAKQENAFAERDTKLIGTKGYAAPEQYGFGPSLIQTDIYGAGMVMNALLTGEPSRRILGEGPLQAVIDRCLRLDPYERPADASALAGLLEACPGSETAFGDARSNPPSPDAGSAADRQKTDFSSPAGCRLHSAPAADNDIRMIHPAAAMAGTSQQPSRRRFLPPGFRTGKPLHMLTGAFGYLAVFYFTMQMEPNAPGDVPGRVGLRITFAALCLCLIACSCNYLDVWQLMPLCKSPNRVLRVLGVILLDAIALIIVFILCLFLFTAMGPV